MITKVTHISQNLLPDNNNRNTQYFANPSVTAELYSGHDCSAGAHVEISDCCFLTLDAVGPAPAVAGDRGSGWSVTFKILEDPTRLWFAKYTAFSVLLTCVVTEVAEGLSPSDSMSVSLFILSFNP
jgi:hypothetical protein